MKWLLPILCCVTCPAFGTLLTIEADDYAAGTNVTELISEVDMYSMGASSGERSDDIYAVPSLNPTGLMGANCLGRYVPDNPYLEFWDMASIFRIDLLSRGNLAKYVYVDMLGKWGYIQGSVTIDSYDSEGVRIGRWFKKSGDSSVSTLLGMGTWNDYNIAYVEVLAFYQVSFDHIVIDCQAIPEPAAILLLSACLPYIRRLQARRR